MTYLIVLVQRLVVIQRYADSLNDARVTSAYQTVCVIKVRNRRKQPAAFLPENVGVVRTAIPSLNTPGLRIFFLVVLNLYGTRGTVRIPSYLKPYGVAHICIESLPEAVQLTSCFTVRHPPATGDSSKSPNEGTNLRNISFS